MESWGSTKRSQLSQHRKLLKHNRFGVLFFMKATEIEKVGFLKEKYHLHFLHLNSCIGGLLPELSG